MNMNWNGGQRRVPTEVARARLLLKAFVIVQLSSTSWMLLPGHTAMSEVSRPALPTSLHATVSIPNPMRGVVDVELQYSDLPTDNESITFQMPERYAFIQLPEPLIEGRIHATDPNAEDLDVSRDAPFRWTIQTPKSGKITLRYRIPLRHRTVPQVRNRDAYEYPYLADDHGMLVTATLFATPVKRPLRTISVKFDLPDKWDVTCPWPASPDGTFAPTSTTTLTNDIIAIGNWSVHRATAEGMEIEIAFAPGQEKLEETTVKVIKAIAEAELELFQVLPAPKYLFLFGRPDTRGLAGSPKSNSMTFSVDERIPPQKLTGSLSHLIAHEFFHLWGTSRYHCPDELRFLNEGFTDYFAYLIPARKRIVSWDEFYKALEQGMATCESNALRDKSSLSEAGGPRFFSDSNARDLTYQGGLLVAALLDAQLRNSGTKKTLDDFMRAFNNDSRWSLGANAPKLDDFISCIQDHLGPGAAADFRKIVTEPYAMNPAREFTEHGVTVTKSLEIPELRLRGNLQGTPPTVLRDLDPTGLAFRIGVRPGDRFLLVNGIAPKTRTDVYSAWSKPADQRISVTVDRDGTQVIINEPISKQVVFRVSRGSWDAPENE